MYARLIAPQWLVNKGSRKVLEGDFSDEQLKEHNKNGYNIYYLPNYPTNYPQSGSVDGSIIDSLNLFLQTLILKVVTIKAKKSSSKQSQLQESPPLRS